MVTTKRKYLNLGTMLCILLILMLFVQSVSPVFAATASNTLIVNANQVLRPVTHVASGSLYGLANATQPTVALAQAIKPNTFIQKPQGGKQQPDGDILNVASTASAVGAKLVVRFIDYYPGWPYQFNSGNWLSVVDNQIAQIKASPYYSSVSAYAPFNEPDGTWNTANGTFNNIWVTTYREIRAKDPNRLIQGPSFSDNISGNGNAPSMQAFLQNAKNTNTVPDILEWHELIRASKIEGDVKTVQSIQDSLGIARRPISIGEYASPSEVGLPGPLVGYVAKFERLGIQDAELPFWNQSGTLGDLLTGKGGSPNAAYWMYKWYADMSGNMVVTTPPAQTGIDGFAAVPSGNNKVSIIVGGCSGSCAVTVNGLNSLNLGSIVTVKIDQTVSMGRTVAVSGPSTISTTTYTPSNGTISVPITMVTNNAYLITITPGNSGPTPTKTKTLVPGSNFLTNANMESGTTNWVVNGAGTLSSDTSQFHGGTHSVKITGRTSSWNGIGQNVAVSNFPTIGQNYSVSVWVRSETGTPTATATLRLTADTTTYVNLSSAAINSTGWTQLTGTVPVSWSGTLTDVLFYVETAAGTDNLYIDDASLSGNTGPTATPLPGASPTRTSTPGPTNTPVGPTNTPVVPTNTPTSGTGTCSPVTATITAPFTQDGAGTFCWQSSNLGAYINSWNLASLTVNGVNATNLYLAAGSLPAKINGYWYVSYNSAVAWGHFEAK